jgi:hypothetical protein
MIAGPEMEEETWKVFKNRANLDNDSLQAIQQLYFDQMKPVVNDEQACDPTTAVSGLQYGA